MLAINSFTVRPDHSNPKEACRCDWPTDYRPITLVHSIAELIFKLLAIRLFGPCLAQLVDIINQSACFHLHLRQLQICSVCCNASVAQENPKALLKLAIYPRPSTLFIG
jgi:hypothetical protein